MVFASVPSIKKKELRQRNLPKRVHNCQEIIILLHKDCCISETSVVNERKTCLNMLQILYTIYQRWHNHTWKVLCRPWYKLASNTSKGGAQLNNKVKFPCMKWCFWTCFFDCTGNSLFLGKLAIFVPGY